MIKLFSNIFVFVSSLNRGRGPTFTRVVSSSGNWHEGKFINDVMQNSPKTQNFSPFCMKICIWYPNHWPGVMKLLGMHVAKCTSFPVTFTI